jgi:hypothetical protein
VSVARPGLAPPPPARRRRDVDRSAHQGFPAHHNHLRLPLRGDPVTGPTEPSPDVHRTATLLRHLYVALIRVGFEERQALVIVGQAVTAIPSTPSAPTVTLSVDEIAARHARAS